jgi:quercetin dioxygenase-like cupin family protein
VTIGTVRFETPEGNIDGAEGDLIVVPPRAIHTFKNASETEDAEFFMTATPGKSLWIGPGFSFQRLSPQIR